MNKEIYFGFLVRGDLAGAIGYIRQFPEQADLYHRFMDLFDQERYIDYDIDAELNSILTAYQQYYRDIFYLRIKKELAECRLCSSLKAQLGISDSEIEISSLEQHQLVDLFQHHGLYFMGGKTSGYYGPYVWRSTESVLFDVELPDGIQSYSVKLLDGFVTRSWVDFLSFGEIGPGGWADNDGCISCVKAAWDFDSESFQVSLLKHEAQHSRDLALHPNMSSAALEYRAKLIELIYSNRRNLLPAFDHEADSSDSDNGHALAAYRIIKEFREYPGMDGKDISSIPTEQIQAIAKELFAKSSPY